MGFNGLAPPDRWGFFRRSVGVWLVLTLVLGTSVVPEAWAVDYYVNTGGSDAADGSSGAPWKTLTNALGQVVSGDVVHLAAGTYDTPGNGESFPLALVDGVAILGDTANPGTRVLECPGSAGVFLNNDTPLSPSTSLAGVTLRDDGTADSELMWFDVGSATMSPQIDDNIFTGNSSSDEGISYEDASSASGTFTPTIDGNAFDSLYVGVWLYDLDLGPSQVFSPVITNNTFTGCDYPVTYSLSSSPEGTVGGLVEGNTFIGTNYEDVYIYFYPTYSGTGLVFNTTITGNDMQSGASTNVVAYLYGYSYEGDATFAPVITNNTMDATGYNVAMSGYYYYHDGDYTVAPVISGNTMTGASSTAVSLYLTTLSVSSSDQRNVMAPTITNNTITANGGYGVVVDLTDWEYGRIEGTATIAGNSITGAGYGIDWEMSYMSDGTGMDWSIVLSNNTITSPTSDGIYFSMDSIYFSGTDEVFNLTIEGNTITNAGSYGIDAYPAYSWYSSNVLTETVLIRGNTVTGSTNDGMWLYFSDQTSNTLDARIMDNVLTGNGEDGLDIESNDLGSNGIQVACNVLTGNAFNGIYQDDGNDTPAEYGGGGLGSPGGNVIMSNTGFDFYNNDPDPVMAESNWWGTTVSATIDGNISDDEEATGGAVDFTPYLMSATAVTVNAPLTDAVVVDVAPAGASVGDTLQYTALIDTGGGCGDVAMDFAATVDPNTTMVPGSVTTTHGTVVTDDPPAVDIGYLESGTTVTVTWQVVVNGGTSVQTQGTVTATRSGATLTDDPAVGGSADPTVTVLAVPAAGTVQFAPGTVMVNETDGTATLDVTRTGGSFGIIDVDYATADGTAAAPGDYTATSGSLSWPDGNTAPQQIMVPIVDDSDAEGLENFTVTLTDPLGAGVVGTPATATVTIVDDEMQAQPIPTLGHWGLMLFAGLLLLFGFGLLRRRRWAGAGLVVIVVLSLAVPATAGEGKPLAREMYVSTVAALGLSGGQATLRLADGTAVTVPEAQLRVQKGHVKREKGEARPHLTPEQRHAQAVERRASNTRAARLASMEAGTPVFVSVKLDKKDGTIRSVKVWTFDTLEQARAELVRKQSGKKHPRK